MATTAEFITHLFITSLLLPTCCRSCNDILRMANVSGHYCKDSGDMIPWFVSLYECTRLCIQKSTCTATNYNISENTCSLLSAPCPQASNDMAMVYTIFSDIPHDQCLEWLDFSPGLLTDERWALTKVGGDQLNRVVAKVEYGKDIYPAYMSPPHSKCFGTDGHVQFNSVEGHACQLLRVRDGCTIRFVHYTAGDIIPTYAVGLRSLSERTNRYIAIVQPIASRGKYVGGYYIEGTGTAVISYGDIQRTPQMRLLLITWPLWVENIGTFLVNRDVYIHI